MVSLYGVAVLVLFCFGANSGQRKLSRNIPVGTDVKVNFDCPEEFGYYPHPTDCTQYYVCVFGGALLESCTGGLMYSHELQTCDWPRNVGCDGLEVSGPPPSSAASTTSSGRGRDRDRDEPRPRYSPPPPPQPAAVVTSRGQPRQLHHNQQEIIKQQQQQQLYADAEEALPPAEEIESDRQQRVYRGQPSTVGQVQRDRDGLRHSNAIPSYTGRGEKIGLISFGTQNQHYSGVTDIDDILTNDLTLKRRRKRQVIRSRPREEANKWNGARRNNRNTITRANSSSRLPPLTNQNLSRNNAFRPSNPQTKSSNEFQPFTPNYQRQYPTRAPLKIKVQPTIQSANLQTNSPVTPVTTRYNNINNYTFVPFKATNAPIKKPAPTKQEVERKNTVRRQSAISRKSPKHISKNSSNSTTRSAEDSKHTQSVTTNIDSPNKKHGGKTDKGEEDDENTEDSEEDEDEEGEDDDDDDEREHFPPPPEFFNSGSRYEDFVNPFADPNFDFDKFLDKLRGTTTTSKPEPKKVIEPEEDTTSAKSNDDDDNEPNSEKSTFTDSKHTVEPTIDDYRETKSTSLPSTSQEYEFTTNKATVPTDNFDSTDRNLRPNQQYETSTIKPTLFLTQQSKPLLPSFENHPNSPSLNDYHDKSTPPTLGSIINDYYEKSTAQPKLFLKHEPRPAITDYNKENTAKPTLLLNNQKISDANAYSERSPITPALFVKQSSRPLLSDFYKSPTVSTSYVNQQQNPINLKNSKAPLLNHGAQPVVVDFYERNTQKSVPAINYGNKNLPPQYFVSSTINPPLVNYNVNPITNQYYAKSTSRPLLPPLNQQTQNINNQYYEASTIKTIPYSKPSLNEYYQRTTPNPITFANNQNRPIEAAPYKNPPIDRNAALNPYYSKVPLKPKPFTSREQTVTLLASSTSKPRIVVEQYENNPQVAPVQYYYTASGQIIQLPVHNNQFPTQIKTASNTENKIIQKIPPTADVEYYYDDVDYDYPQNGKGKAKAILKNYNYDDRQEILRTPKQNDSRRGEVKFSARYNEKPQPQSTNFALLTTTPKLPANQPSSDIFIAQSIYTTTPKSAFTVRQRKGPSARPLDHTITTTVKPSRGKPKQRLTTQRYDLDTKREQSKVSRSEESSVAPAQPSNPTATATARTLYNSTQYNDNHYDPYYALYDDDVELYRDVDYSQHNNYNNNAQRGQTQSYNRGTPAPVVQSTSTREEPPKRGNSVYIQNTYNPQDIYQSTGTDYHEDNRYDTQVDDQTPYRQPGRQPSRGDRNEINDVEEAITKRTTTSTRKPTTTTTRTTTTTTTTTPRTNPPKKSTPPPARTSSRGRGTAHYASTGAQITNNEVTVNSNRGTPAPRSRPTLKPSTSIVSKAQEFIDIYKFPPRRPDPIYPQPQPDKTAAKCRKDVCLLPDCSCGGKEIPGNVPVDETPQMVLITFDDAVNDLNKQYYIELFENGRKNPNGCPISATFYVSHEWTDYSQVQNLYADGHELASHTVSHSFGEQFSQKKWTREVAGQREILSAYGGVHLEDVRGMRAPFLSVGGNKMFKMLYDSNFTYDSSMPIYENKPPSWPYTLDYKLFHDCMIPPCPTRSYPGVWEVPMVMWQDLNGGRCSMGDACSNPPDADGVFKMLTKNFQRHYTTNRAPFGLFYHAAWFTQPHHKEGFINFIDSILAMKDVWLVTNWQAIQWVRDPTPTSRLNSFQPFQCDYTTRPRRCNNPKVCNLWHKSGVRYMRTCQPCPEIYPWTGNTGIRSSKIDNDIED